MAHRGTRSNQEIVESHEVGLLPLVKRWGWKQSRDSRKRFEEQAHLDSFVKKQSRDSRKSPPPASIIYRAPEKQSRDSRKVYYVTVQDLPDDLKQSRDSRKIYSVFSNDYCSHPLEAIKR